MFQSVGTGRAKALMWMKHGVEIAWQEPQELREAAWPNGGGPSRHRDAWLLLLVRMEDSEGFEDRCGLI